MPYIVVDAIEAISRVLNAANVRFIVVGGLAVYAHGSDRHTHDLDLVIQLQPDNIARAFSALAAIDYRPHLPIKPEQFADSELCNT